MVAQKKPEQVELSEAEFGLLKERIERDELSESDRALLLKSLNFMRWLQSWRDCAVIYAVKYLRLHC